MDISLALDQLSALQYELRVSHEAEEKLATELVPEDIRQKIKETRTEFALRRLDDEQKEKKLKEEIENAVLVLGETQRGQRLMAMYTKGRRGSWDPDRLEGYAAAHPEILVFRKPDGKPYVTIKEI